MGSMLTASEGNSTMSAVRPCRSLFRCAKRPLPSSHGVRLASYQSRWVAVGHGGSYESQGTPPKQAIVADRFKELQQAAALEYPRYRPTHGAQPWPHRFRSERAAPTEADLQSPSLFEVCGRVLSNRQFGSKLAFVNVLENSNVVQIKFNLADMPDGAAGDFKRLVQLLKRGDHISAAGRVGQGKDGRPALFANQLPRLFSPALVPIPFRLQDDNTKARQPHIDLLTNETSRRLLLLRSLMLSNLRAFLLSERFVEVQTPILGANAGGAIARPFATAATDLPSRELALRIAPELWLKRLILGGLDRVFEIGPVFRNEGLDTTHNPEFTTCEFYAAYWTLEDLIGATEVWLMGLTRQCRTEMNDAVEFLPPDGDRAAWAFERIEFIPAIQAALGFPLPDLTADTAMEDLLALLRDHKFDLGPDQPKALPQLLDRLAGMFIEPKSQESPIFIVNHPECMSPLSKSFTCPATGQPVAARAELFVQGMEIANMYEEENDPSAQRRKMVAQARLRSGDPTGEEGDGTVADESYLAALEAGLPPTGGWGCGIERLMMVLGRTKRISDCLSFGSLRNVVALASTGMRE